MPFYSRNDSTTFDEIQQFFVNWTDYYNSERYQWDLAKLAMIVLLYPSILENSSAKPVIKSIVKEPNPLSYMSITHLN